ncbi:MAG: PTS sugar transporter subunit IIC [Firmicutes bacterium]|nr:PTS sugar transporter subunit IIC [Bacillota bacterium]
MFFQAALVAIITWVVATYLPMSVRWALYFGGPLMAGLIDGLIFGNVPLGLQIGATIQMAYVGLVAAGGTLPSDLALAGYLGVALGIIANATPEVAMTLAVPLGLLGLLAFNTRMTLNAFWVHKADEYAEKGDTRGIILMNVVCSQIFPFLVYVPTTFLAIYYGSGWVNTALTQLPKWLIDALKVTGGLLPALGLGMLLKFLAKPGLIPYLFLGWVMATYLKMDVMAVAIVGACIGALRLYREREKAA